MAGCARCTTGETFLFECANCGGAFCLDHRAPADHQCAGVVFQDHIEHPTDEKPDQGEQSEPEPQPPVEASEPEPDSETGSRIRSVVRSIPRAGILSVIIVVLVSAAGAGVLWHGSGAALPVDGNAIDRDAIPLVGGSSVNSSAQTGDVRELNTTEVERLVHQYVNQEREVRGQPPLDYDAELAAIAAYHSTDMGKYNYTAHVSPDGETFEDRLRKFNYSCATRGELTLYTYYDLEIATENGTVRYESANALAGGIVQGWMRSNAHQTTLLRAAWERAGVGVVVTDANKVYVTLNLCGS